MRAATGNYSRRLRFAAQNRGQADTRSRGRSPAISFRRQANAYTCAFRIVKQPAAAELDWPRRRAGHMLVSLPMDAHFLAFDLGAERGRAMSGRLRSSVLDLAEVCRFPNEPVREHGSLHWDILRLWTDMQRALERLESDVRGLDSIGVDAWGCDYGLLGERGELVGNPYHYRDARTDGIMEAVCATVGRARIYDVTGTQFLSFNTLYQLIAARQRTPRLLDAATGFCTIPDILDYWLTGVLRAEYPSATTTQMVDARARNWADALLRDLDIPTRLLPALVEAGTVLGGLKGPSRLEGTPVVAPACHDTGSAVASVPAFGGRAFVSSGTWSLVGVEVPQPIITAGHTA